MKVGTFMWLRNETRKIGVSPKFSSKWLGPYLIIEKLSDVTYRIQETPRSKSKVVHFDRLKSYLGKPMKNWLEDRPNPDETVQDSPQRRVKVRRGRPPLVQTDPDTPSRENGTSRDHIIRRKPGSKISTRNRRERDSIKTGSRDYELRRRSSNWRRLTPIAEAVESTENKSVTGSAMPRRQTRSSSKNKAGKTLALPPISSEKSMTLGRPKRQKQKPVRYR